MLTLVDQKGPIRGPDRSSRLKGPPTLVEDFAEEIVNGIFCTYEPPTRSSGKKKKKKTTGILRPPNSFLRERSSESQKSVRWIDDDSPPPPPPYPKGQKGIPSEIGISSIANSCLEAGVEAGCMSPAKSQLATDEIGQSISQDSNVSLQRESRAHRYAVFDEEGNPISTKAGVEAPPPPPPTPPPNKSEVFIPQLCGVELNCADDGDRANPSLARTLYESMTRYEDEEGDDNSLLAGDMGPPQTRAPLGLKRTKSSSSGARLGGGHRGDESSWENLRNRLDASEDDWDLPDWMEGGQRADSRDEVVESQARYNTMMDPVARDRSEIGLPNIQQEDDWDSSMPDSVHNDTEPSIRSDQSAKEDAAISEAVSDARSEGTTNEKRRSSGIFGLGRKKERRESSPCRPRRRSWGKGSDAAEPKVEESSSQVLMERKPPSENGQSEAGKGSTVAANWRERSAAIMEKRRRNRNNANSKTSESGRSGSRSPGRRFLRSSEATEPSAARETPIIDENKEVLDSAPMPHLHPAHPLNQVRRQLQSDDGVERQSYIMQYRQGTNDFPRSQTGASDQDDRMSYITAQRQYFGDDRRSQAASDAEEKMSYITASRADQRSQVASDAEDRLSYITASRLDQRSQAASDVEDRMSYITASRADQRSQVASDVEDKMSYITASRALDQRSRAPDEDDRMSYITQSRAQFDQRSRIASEDDDKMSYITASRQFDQQSQMASEADDKMSFITASRAQLDFPPPPPPPLPPSAKPPAENADDAIDQRQKERRESKGRRKFKIPSPKNIIRRLSKSPEKQRESAKNDSEEKLEVEPKPMETEITEAETPKDTATKTMETNKEEPPKQQAEVLDASQAEMKTAQTTVKQLPQKEMQLQEAPQKEQTNNVPAETQIAEQEKEKDIKQPEEQEKTEKDDKTKQEEKKEEEISWEERTRLAWERIRGGFGLSETTPDPQDGSDEEKTGRDASSELKPGETKASELETSPKQQQEPESTILPVVSGQQSSTTNPNDSANSIGSGSSVSSQGSQGRLKGILKAPAGKRVTFVEDVGEIPSTLEHEGTEVEADENDPPQDTESEVPLPIQNEVVHKDAAVPEALGESTQQVAQVNVPGDQQPPLPSADQTKKSKKKGFRGRNLFFGKGKNKASSKSIPDDANVNSSRGQQQASSVPVSEPPKPREDGPANDSPVDTKEALDEQQQQGPENTVAQTSDQVPEPISHPPEQQTGEHLNVPTHQQQPVPVQQQQSAGLHLVLQQPNGTMIDLGEPPLQEAKEKKEPRRSRFSLLGRRDRSSSSKQPQPEGILMLSPTGPGDTTTTFFRQPLAQQQPLKQQQPQQQPPPPAPAGPMMHPYQQGYVYSQQPYGYLNPAASHPPPVGYVNHLAASGQLPPPAVNYLPSAGQAPPAGYFPAPTPGLAPPPPQYMVNPSGGYIHPGAMMAAPVAGYAPQQPTMQQPASFIPTHPASAYPPQPVVGGVVGQQHQQVAAPVQLSQTESSGKVSTPEEQDKREEEPIESAESDDTKELTEQKESSAKKESSGGIFSSMFK